MQKATMVDWVVKLHGFLFRNSLWLQLIELFGNAQKEKHTIEMKETERINMLFWRRKNSTRYQNVKNQQPFLPRTTCSMH